MKNKKRGRKVRENKENFFKPQKSMIFGAPKSKSFLRKHYSLSWKYIKESKNYILFVLILILGSILIGLLYQPAEIDDVIDKFIKGLVEETQGLNWWQMIIYILNNNLQSSFFAMILGIFFGIFPVIAGFSNGYVLGFVAEKAVVAGGISSLWRLLPHGIFEFPAIILSLALGTKFGMFFFAGKGKRKKEFVKRLENSLRVFLLIVIPLLIIAAIIEGILIVVLT